ncbi:MAG TPA: tetratricopeptide repeat protein [Anaerolineae bacterium]|nr:tetratricopeptide repeat protein [Anaerolineae bacterium]HQK14145.1 tetratricopeptide repeat protein [Anaerolineae bacterium]
MSKRKKRSRSAPNRQGAATLRTRGVNAFQSGDYDQAIETWVRVRSQSPEMLPAAALAEAYFRRGLESLNKTPPDFEKGMRDLRRAVELHPEDECYTYHLGLACQRSGDLKTAITYYEKVRKNPDSPFAHRAAYPLALALLQEGVDPTGKGVWADLTEQERTMLRSAGVFRRRPYGLDGDAPLLWHGLAALDAGETEKARDLLQQALRSPGSLQEANIARYYLGVLAARAEDWDEARKRWTEAYAQGYRSTCLSQNLGELYFRLAEQCLSEGDAESALAAANESARHGPADGRFNEVLSSIHQRLGYQAALASRWDKALDHWEAARDLDGGNFRLAYNLALAYEKIENFIAAGEMWREALRRRPRRAEHPDAITDEQVALLWKRAAEAYVKAGEYEEAINVYKQAVKWNPEDLEIRMALVDGLINDGRLWAAENELQRILEKNADYIPALLRLGEVLAENDDWWIKRNATNYWKRVLALDPHNIEARDALANYYLDEGENQLSRLGDYQSALAVFEQALQYRSDDAYLLARVGMCYMNLEQTETAESFLDRALNCGASDLRVYEQLIRTWLDGFKPERAWEVMRLAEARIKDIPYQFYVVQGVYAMEVEPAWGKAWLDRAAEVIPPAEDPLAKIGHLLVLSMFPDIAQQYLESALAAGQDVAHVNLSLAMLALRRGDTQAAKRYLRDAERAARKVNDQNIGKTIAVVRDLINMPPELLNLMLQGIISGAIGGPGGLPFPGLFDLEEYDDDEEEWDDDDQFFNPFRY